MVRVAFIGVGGIGGWLGARLIESQAAEVLLIARGEHGTAIKEKGLCLRVGSAGSASPPETLQLPPGSAEVYASVAEAVERRAKPVDFAVLGVKTWQVREAAAEAAPLLATRGCVVTTQNGVEAPDEAAAAVGHERVLGGMCKVIAFIAQPGLVQMNSAPATFDFGEVFDGTGAVVRSAASERSEQLAAVFKQCRGTAAAMADGNMWAVMWGKAVSMCSFGPIAALCRAPMNNICSIAETRALVKAAMLEVAACAFAAGHRLGSAGTTPDEFVEELIAMVSKVPPGTTPSTLRDIVTGKPSELHELTGAILRAGQKLEVPTPTHSFVFAALLPQEMRARGDAPYELLGVPGGAPHVHMPSSLSSASL